MAVYIDVQCSKCEATIEDVWSDRDGQPHICGGTLERLWSMTRTGSQYCSEREKVEVFINPRNGQVAYPPIPGRKMPAHLKGFERTQLTPNQLGAFEKKHNVISEIRHMNRNGRGLDGA